MTLQRNRRSNVTKMAALSALVALSSRKHLVRAFTTSNVARSHSIIRSVDVTPTPVLIQSGRSSLVRLFSASTDLSAEQKADLEAQIKSKGDEIRALKDSGADKATVAPLVEELLSLKATLDPSSVKPKKEKKKKQNNNGKKEEEAKVDEQSDFITPRAEDYSKWYNDIIRVTGLAETSPVRGCMVIKPWGMSLWETVRDDLDKRIKEHGAENAYFPLLIRSYFPLLNCSYFHF